MSDLDWQPVDGRFFVGEAQLAMHTDTPACSVGEVAFTAGCRNNWHTHPVAQILVVTAGCGLYQEEGQPARLFASRAGGIYRCWSKPLAWCLP